MPDYLRHVRELSEVIGPRGSTTPAERKAAEYIAGRLRDAGGQVELQPFQSHSSFAYPYGLIYLLGVLGAAALWYNAGLALVLGAGAALLFWWENNAVFSLGILFPRRASQNVIGRFAPGGAPGAPGRTVVLVAHYDSSKSGLMFDPKQVRFFRYTFLATAASIVAVPLLAVLGMLLAPPVSATADTALGLAAPRGVAQAGLPFGVYLLFGVALLAHRELFGRYTPGANDNGSGVSVLLETVAALQQRPLRQTEVWAVATGCEEVGLVGMSEFVKVRGAELREALFVNLDNLGAGRPKYTTGEGMLLVKPCDDRLVAVAQKVARRHPDWGIEGVTNTIMLTDAQVPLNRGMRVISIRAEDEHRLLPNWHWHTDVAGNVEPRTLGVVGDFLREVLEEIDAGTAD